MKPKKPPIPTSPARTSAMTEKAVTWHHEATRRLAVSGSHSSEGLCWVVVKLPYVPLHRGQACARPRAGRTARLIWGNRRDSTGRAETPRHGGGPSQARRGALVPVASRRPRASRAVGWFGGRSNRRRGHRLPWEISTRIRWRCRGCRRGAVQRTGPAAVPGATEGQRKKMSLLISSTE